MKTTSILNEKEIENLIVRLAHEISEKNKNLKDIVLLGIKDRGDIIASRIADRIKKIKSEEIPVGALDIAFYRDDINMKITKPQQTELPCDINGKNVILVDDVLYTGRSIRAALDALIDFGRPKTIQLAVLIDRGHREFPIQADYVGKNIPTSQKEKVEVKIKEMDKKEEVVIEKP